MFFQEKLFNAQKLPDYITVFDGTVTGFGGFQLLKFLHLSCNLTCVNNFFDQVKT
jgi:hypothetical protein